ncbi:heat shock protein HspQ [Bathymodiolus platifrons methanotrophic gill symbiont]|uniref:heat shock protein HspQ n=1 Tax=Bathymodiolus platifrons methanotrophic gill symbiont TaxID=113268 RepID=UPI000B4149AA|nr:heat shock protein HspQ [Bathymodiolus platifrons methanotrophic gill symbiont]MCK5870883.1 heat shock protein HspQ [Methyloprofundus sp.]TXK95743.1 DNA-binding protein [Methylococcaceae bacterium CS4]TXK96929.1 DNA-binding protein [Methylococcaceae bacterium CS5]TXK99789.1 DNA-binding protein [Methylococcaceae bacterium HT1]TXL05112.1 DNA-binding protein [Methylococcaceae bacterium CS3]TXL08779.1 DNA-binding protein [Methylococcaceae bacterium CS1]TXL10074.1 DNA-binding protein [Methyloc
MNEAKFSIGKIIQHQLFNYRGVVIDVDYKFLGSEQWYDQVARSHPPKDQPWYHVLVDNSNHQTYVAERNLEISDDISVLNHPLLDHYFTGINKGNYQLRTKKN